MSSWIEAEHTNRTYRLEDGHLMNVDNNIQEVKCPRCDGVIFCRMTLVSWARKDGSRELFAAHNNYDVEIAPLRVLLVQYMDGEALEERLIDNKWSLVKNGMVIGVAI